MENTENEFLKKLRDEEQVKKEEKNYSDLCDDFADFIIKNGCKQQGEDEDE